MLSLPTDVQDVVLTGNVAPLALAPAPGPMHPDPNSVRRLGEAIGRAKQSVFIAGRGAVNSGAEEAITALADRSGALLATTVCGHGLFANHRWSLGISGGFASPAASELIAESDLIVGFGVSLTHWTTKRGKLIAPVRLSPRLTLRRRSLAITHQSIFPCSPMHEPRRRRYSSSSARRSRRGWRNEGNGARMQEGDNHHAPYADVSNARFIDPRTLSKAVDELLPPQRVVASDSGHFCGWVPRYLRVPNARSSCLSHSFQSVGLGLASAIGLGIANPGALVVLGAGDGGFLMSLADLETAVRLKLRMCVLLYNDASYAAEVHLFKRRGYSIDIAQFPDTDFAAIARGHGARAATVRTLDDLDPVRAWVDEGAPGVFVIDGKISPDLEADWHAEHFP